MKWCAKHPLTEQIWGCSNEKGWLWQECGILKSSLVRDLSSSCVFYLYRVSVVQKLRTADLVSCLNFYNWMLTICPWENYQFSVFLCEQWIFILVALWIPRTPITGTSHTIPKRGCMVHLEHHASSVFEQPTHHSVVGPPHMADLSVCHLYMWQNLSKKCKRKI